MNPEGCTQESDTTPPTSFTDHPLTPPRTDEKTTGQIRALLDEIRSCKSGQYYYDTPWVITDLDRSEFKALQPVFRKDGFVQDKLRYDYFASTEQFVLRMPSAIHEEFAAAVEGNIAQQLAQLAGHHSPSAIFTRAIRNSGSTTITFDDPEYGKHDPDASFRHSDAQYPGIVIEVCYSQKAQALPHLADDYILGSDGNIRAVVGFDISYSRKKATLSVWKPHMRKGVDNLELTTEQTTIDQIFRNDDGTHNDNHGAGLRLLLKDFATEALTEQHHDLEESVCISALDLCRYLDDAERAASIMRQKRGVVNPKPARLSKRRRRSTPPEELDEVHEEIYQEEESRAAKRHERDDQSYRTTSTTFEADSS